MSNEEARRPTLGRLAGVFVGGPKTLRDEAGEWQSSIAREVQTGPVQVEHRGLTGDRATQPYHGTPEIAVCLHFMAHYQNWNRELGLTLEAGAVGENLTLDTSDESDLCAGDVLQIGTARLQISAPRTPCETQARHIGRPDWVKLTLQALRTGLYARVLAPGQLQAGDEVFLEARPNPGLTMRALTQCYYHAHQDEVAQRFIRAEGLMAWWKKRLQKRLRGNLS